VKICNQFVKKVKKDGFSDWTQGGQIQFLQEAKSILKRANIEPKGQMKNVGPGCVIWNQIC